jgi:hypothetical protein
MENIKNMTNHELGVIAKAFMECGTYERCIDCPCDGVLCSRDDFGDARMAFQQEVFNRLMDD